VVVLSYHSLEDRLTKRLLRELSRSTAPPDLPVVPAGDEPQLKLLTRGAEQAEPAEIDQNPRAASVRLRAAERIKEAA
jgi:16S rRNA (cytosine1402-N4)-methyltransferase